MTDLLKPRFEIIADYPNSPYNIGDIAQSGDKSSQIHLMTNWMGSENYCNEHGLLNYPALFRKLNWWEKREDSEMPMYLKIVQPLGQEQNPIYKKVLKWELVFNYGLNEWTTLVDVEEPTNVISGGKCIITLYSKSNHQPATEEEYLNSLK